MKSKKLKYKPIAFEQRSDKWLEWRKLGIGASEASVLMGSLPFMFEDVLELWKKKAGLPVPEFQMNDAIQLGIDTEDEALEAFTKATGISMTPQCFTHPEHSFLRASLDGISDDLTQAVEIKCPSAAKYYIAKKGEIIPYYYTQIQSQMLCAGLDEIYYWVYRIKEGGVLLKAKRNDEYLEELLRRARIFWEMVQAEEPCLPHHLGIDINKDSDPYQAGEMHTELVGVYKN